MVKKTDVDHPEKGVTENPWQTLRQFTAARIGLGRAGVSVPTQPMLAFQLAHAQARDAVHLPLDCQGLITALTACDLSVVSRHIYPLHSQADNRHHYLQRPDLGRCLSPASIKCLQSEQVRNDKGCDLAIVIADGLSSLAIQKNTPPLIQALDKALEADSDPWSIAAITVVEQGRVAIGDHIGELLQARAVLVLIGERPGLSSPDSMGLYLTWAAKQGCHDARRNCISNVREDGLPIESAVNKLMYLLRESRRRQLSGVHLKERSGENIIEPDTKTSLL